VSVNCRCKKNKLTRPSTDIVLRTGDIRALLVGEGGGISAGETDNETLMVVFYIRVHDLGFLFPYRVKPTSLMESESVRFVEGSCPLQVPRFDLVSPRWRSTTFGPTAQ